MRGLGGYQYTEKTAAFSFIYPSARRGSDSSRARVWQGQFQGQFWGQQGSRNSKPRVYLGFSSR
jgi:hypothetical protein